LVDMSPELVTVVMFGSAIAGIIIGYPLVFVLGTIALFVGVATLGTPAALGLFYVRLWGMMTNYVFLAVPMFVFMGMMVEKSGSAERLYSGLHLAFGPFRGGLAIATIMMGTILAACVGVIAASVIMIALIAMPSMLQRGYRKELVCGSVCAGGTLGILIPPSLMLVVYGPMAELSVGKLFMGAFGPGLLLSALYMTYVAIRAWLRPAEAPPLPVEERNIPAGPAVHRHAAAAVPHVQRARSHLLRSSGTDRGCSGRSPRSHAPYSRLQEAELAGDAGVHARDHAHNLDGPRHRMECTDVRRRVPAAWRRRGH